MLEFQENWRELLSAIAVFALLLFFAITAGKRRFPDFGSTGIRATKPPVPLADDLPVEVPKWHPDVCVFDEPLRFGYRVFTDRHDRIVEAADLPANPGTESRIGLLDRLVGLNSAATGELVRRLRARGVCDTTCAAILIDHSGSMRRAAGQGPERPAKDDLVVSDDSAAAFAASVAITLAEALDECGASTEILGFTTREWRGGQSRQDGIRAGRPSYPGRLNDVLHIIYKHSDEGSVARCIERLEAFLHPPLLKENIDGEAIAWARGRLLAQPAPDRVLIVISDGAAVDDSTLHENGGRYLERHFRHVVTDIERRRDLRLVGIGIGYEVSRYYPHSVSAGRGANGFAERLDAFADLISGMGVDRAGERGA